MSDGKSARPPSIKIEDRNAPFVAPSWASRIPDETAFYLQGTAINDDQKQFLQLKNKSHWICGQPKPFNPDISLTHKSISRQNSVIIYHGELDSFFLVDLQSAFGTYLNGVRLRPCEPAMLKVGDGIRFGGCEEMIFYLNCGVVESKNSEDSRREKSYKYVECDNLPRKVRVSHLLVKHSGSRNPRSWRQDGFITRTKDEAIRFLKEYKKALSCKECTFAELAKLHSDCSSAKRGGDLGFFEYEQMQARFSEAAFALEKGQLSDVVETDSGVHLIMRTA